ncbi:MAG TPA: hypothetical protein DCM87_01325 [Planctomycetes bacterium]|nr:hypothetical protein [Planctomycetota bacterium]
MRTLQACILVIAVSAPAAGGELAAAFRSPPDAARPWTYWWWLNGHVSREGITADLEAMKRQGIGGVLIFNAGGGATPPGLTFMGPEWLASGFDDRAWPAALNAAPYGGGPWGRPSLSVADLQVAEVCFLREGDARVLCRASAPVPRRRTETSAENNA